VLHTPSLHVRIHNAEQCTNCKLCTKACPMSIDVCEHVRENKPLPSQCVQCGKCNDTCSKDIFSFSFGSERA
jgi:polyferredoxin